MKVYYTNCRSIVNKIDYLRGLTSVEKFDIIALTETWLDMSGKIFGLEYFHKDRKGRKERRVAFYVRDTLQCCVNNVIKIDDRVESIWLEVREAARKTVLGVVYRPPNLSKGDSTPVWQINRACNYKQLCVLGDFNLRNIDWDLTVGDNDAEDLLKLVQDNFLNQIIREPTRGDSILDLILTNRDDLVKEADVGGQLGNSDHCEIRFILKGEKKL